MYKCKKCGGTDVEILEWRNANTGDFAGDYTGEDQDTWCCDCEEHTGIEWTCGQCEQNPCICVKLHSPNAG